jgi:hypothetical protein
MLIWRSLSDERTCLPFTFAAGPRQRSQSWVRDPRDSLPYFSVSDSRLSQPRGPGPRIYIPQEHGGLVIPPGTGFPFRRLLRLAGLRWRYSKPPPRGVRQVNITLWLTVRQSDIYCSLTVKVLLFWGALSDKRTGLYFVYATGPRHRSYSRVRVPWYSWPYFTVSDLRLPFSSSPTTHRVAVEVFDPASTRVIPVFSHILLARTYKKHVSYCEFFGPLPALGVTRMT